MVSINIKVAFCTSCKGYYAATPYKKEHAEHPEIVDHFFYHGEPWFTLDNTTFEKITQNENTEIRVLKLSEHRANDHQYCHCSKKALQKSADKKSYITKSTVHIVDYYEVYADLYFKDLYHTYNNFHGAETSATRSISA
ncbi:hypothetical protein N0B16_01770 [Chryseobacterium sp. GMJ5]|uniref:Uncharacterized protein n=1 Tax=Chryseobacterium gilvum TaxID=2976534 RepID=A0ABT2VT26_9FLAO|nr:hypothetical protein [Chryseobacterium gilvum]MCU7613150.1 hypothetical protein [Chryseobacterium gilvum]